LCVKLFSKAGPLILLLIILDERLKFLVIFYSTIFDA